MRSRRLALTVTCVLAVLGASTTLLWQAVSQAATPGHADLQIVYNGARGWQVTLSLACDPASGTIADPAQACAEIARHPGMVFSSTGRDHSCPPSASVAIHGTDAGQPVNVVFSPCVSSSSEEAGLARWTHFLPSEAQETRVRPDHGIGLLSLGESATQVRSLLGRPHAVTNGLDIYEPWSSLSGGCGGGIGGSYTLHPTIVAVRYDSAGRAISLFADDRSLVIDGHTVPSLVLDCIDFGHETPQPQSALARGPLEQWIAVSCGGAQTIANHRLTGRVTAIVQSGDYPIVLVTAAPASACKDAATIRRAWRVEAPAGHGG